MWASHSEVTGSVAGDLTRDLWWTKRHGAVSSPRIFFFLFSPAYYHSAIASYSLLPRMCDGPHQAAHYHNLGLQVEGLISDWAPDWMLSKEVRF